MKSRAIITVLLLAAAAPALAAEFNPKTIPPTEEIRKMQWWKACVAWGVAIRKSSDSPRSRMLLDYLSSQHMISGKDLAHVNDRTLDIGMTECGMFASRGLPEQANHTTTAAGTSTQYVYPGRYVYTEPDHEYSVGVIRAIQH